MTRDGFVLLVPQSSAVRAIICSEGPSETCVDGENVVFSVRVYKNVVRSLRSAGISVSRKRRLYFESFFGDPPASALCLAPHVLQKLYAFQVRAVQKAVDLGGKVFLGDACGLGKKHVALAIASHFRNDRPVLVISDRARNAAWAHLGAEILGEEFCVAKRLGEIADGSLIVDHVLAMRHYKKLLLMNFKIAIVDDAHFVLRDTSFIAMRFSKLLTQIDKIVFVSAAISALSVLDWFVVFQIFFSERFLSAPTYKNRYRKMNDELRCLIGKYAVANSRSDELAPELPAVHRRVVHVGEVDAAPHCGPWSREDRAAYKRETARKRAATCKYIANFILKAQSVAVVVYFRRTAEFLKKKFPNDCTIFDGDADAFNAGDTPIAVLTYKKLAPGLFFDVASVFIAELHWKPHRIAHAEGIANQRVAADVHYLLRGRIEHSLWQAISPSLSGANH